MGAVPHRGSHEMLLTIFKSLQGGWQLAWGPFPLDISSKKPGVMSTAPHQCLTLIPKMNDYVRNVRKG